MAHYDTPVEVRPLERLILGFSSECGRNPMTVFEDFLAYVLHGFSPGAPPLKSWKYKRNQNAEFMRMFYEWLSMMKSALDGGKEWYDALGELYMAFTSKGGRSAQGQFFTPPPVCDLMAACTANNGSQQGARVSDPTCGSGRLLLAYHVRNLGCYLVGEDIDRTCCMMSVCNMLVHGCVGEVVWHDSLRPGTFSGGWYVNPFLTRTGIPSIRIMTENEYKNKNTMPSPTFRRNGIKTELQNL